VSYLVQARHRERAASITFGLVSLYDGKTEPSSVQEAEQFVKEWGDYNKFWEYTLVNPESKMQSQFDLEQE
jgi:hypothetical protein